jgi:hypothetical protein
MFSNQKKESYAKMLGLTLFQLDESVYRLRGYLNSILKNETLSYNQVLTGYFCLEAVIKDSKRAQKSVINHGTIRNENIKKYGAEILNLKKDGYGAQRIMKVMKVNHNVKISKSTLERFIKLNREYING